MHVSMGRGARCLSSKYNQECKSRRLICSWYNTCTSCNITKRMLSIVGERELHLHSESHVLCCMILVYIYTYTATPTYTPYIIMYIFLYYTLLWVLLITVIKHDNKNLCISDISLKYVCAYRVGPLFLQNCHSRVFVRGCVCLRACAGLCFIHYIAHAQGNARVCPAALWC